MINLWILQQKPLVSSCMEPKAQHIVESWFPKFGFLNNCILINKYIVHVIVSSITHTGKYCSHFFFGHILTMNISETVKDIKTIW